MIPMTFLRPEKNKAKANSPIFKETKLDKHAFLTSSASKSLPALWRKFDSKWSLIKCDCLDIDFCYVKIHKGNIVLGLHNFLKAPKTLWY